MKIRAIAATGAALAACIPLAVAQTTQKGGGGDAPAGIGGGTSGTDSSPGRAGAKPERSPPQDAAQRQRDDASKGDRSGQGDRREAQERSGERDRKEQGQEQRGKESREQGDAGKNKEQRREKAAERQDERRGKDAREQRGRDADGEARDAKKAADRSDEREKAAERDRDSREAKEDRADRDRDESRKEADRGDGDRRQARERDEEGRFGYRGEEGVQRGDRADDAQVRQRREAAERKRVKLRADVGERERNRLRDIVRRRDFRRSDVNVDVRIGIGFALPPTVVLYEMPPTIVEIAPAYRAYRYVVVEDSFYVVDPETHVVVDVIGRDGDGRHTAGLDLTEAEIRLIKDTIDWQRARADYDGRLSIGIDLPGSVTLVPFPDRLVEEIPEIRRHRYAVIDDDVAIVAPNQTVVYLIED